MITTAVNRDATGDHNRLLSDGQYSYTYDNEGNIASKTNLVNSTSVRYQWDHRNRLVKVTFKDDQGAPTKIVEYAYDFGNRWIRKVLDADADLTPDASRVFVHDGAQIVLDYEGAGGAGLGVGELAHRYLWGPATDQLLADEAVDCGADQTPGTADDVRWTLGDHLNSVRDWAQGQRALWVGWGGAARMILI